MKIKIIKIKNLMQLSWLLILFSAVPLFAIGQGNTGVMDSNHFLKQFGYPTETIDDIMNATKSDNYAIRHVALEELTKRIGQDAIPTLKIYLSDPKVEVRHRAAHLLGTLGDKSGLEQMRKDLHALAPDNGRPALPEPNMKPRDLKRMEDERNSKYVEALWVSTVLAELGDYSGYELAAELAFTGQLVVQKNQAILTLVEIAKGDERRLKAEGKDPISILCKVAKEEKNISVLRSLTSAAQKLDPNNAILIVETAKSSPVQNEFEQKRNDIILKQIQKTKNKDFNEPNR